MSASLAPAKPPVKPRPGRRLREAVRRNAPLSRAGLSEAVFAGLFQKLVYAQIWEDPEVDMAALAIAPGNTVVTIASGGCNALSYLLADPGRIEAVDLNPAHVAFNRLKLAALRFLPDYEAFHRFYGRADDARNVEAYRRYIRPALDPATRAYWDGRSVSGRRRISMFGRHLYRHGLLGNFIGWGHRVARFYGAEAVMSYALLQGPVSVNLRLFADSVRGQLRGDAGGDLPRITPDRYGAGIDGGWKGFRYAVDLRRNARQSRTGLAELLSTDRSALSRALSELKRDGILMVDGNRFCLTDPDKLAAWLA